jgi:ATP phosphoribosyltransferase
MLTIALPKGRIAEESLEIFKKILDKNFSLNERQLICNIENLRFLFVRNQDIPAYVFYQSADMGIVGLDVLEEKKADVIRLLDLGIGRCKISIGIKDKENLDFSKSFLKVATKLENITRDFFSKRAIAVEIIKLYGSIEIAPLLGLADMIVDIVQTGKTMKANGLKPALTIMESSAYLIANKNSFYIKKKEILSLCNQIKQVIAIK